MSLTTLDSPWWVNHLRDKRRDRVAAGPDWAPGTLYEIGDQRLFDGVLYEALERHWSQAGFDPPDLPLIWAEVVEE